MRALWLVLLGLAACSNAPVVTESYPDMQTQEFHVYAENCSVCHAPPQPTAHTAGEWPAVIARMQNKRIQRGLGPIMSGDMVKVRDYLILHAKKEGA
ncbi:MAG TPA: hypothetical protein VNI58_00920 [Mariprofundaceae bacterium]|nr:hypothetical protein [Mariprofundaceae bacterium]